MKATGFVEAEDAAYWKPTGGVMGIPRVTTAGGRRTSSTSVYLKPVLESQSNIKLSIDTDVREILLSGTTATGLKAVREGKKEIISLAEGGLVVASGGGVKTPQLLLQSGIGPGMKVANDAVGKNLSDKPMRWYSFDVPGVEGYNLTHPILKDQTRFVEKGEGPLAQFGPLLVGFVEVPPAITGTDKVAEKVYPTEKFMRKNLVEFFVPTAQVDGKVKVYFVHLNPQLDPESPAAILPNMTVVGKQWDADYSAKSFDHAMGVVMDAMTAQGYAESESGSEAWDHNMNHPGGTCGLGKCIGSSSLIVKGVENIGVCDNSIVPEQATVHTAHTLMGIALHCSDILTSFLTGEDTKEIKDEL